MNHAKNSNREATIFRSEFRAVQFNSHLSREAVSLSTDQCLYDKAAEGNPEGNETLFSYSRSNVEDSQTERSLGRKTIYIYHMRIPLIAILLLIGLSAAAQKVEPECLSRMKKGVFIPDQEGLMEVIRTSKEHVEVFEGGDSKLFHAIHWENDSTYTLTMKRAVNAITCLKKGEIKKTTITACRGDRYETESISVYCGSSKDSFVKEF